jgi:hypothetical protein
MPTVKKMSKITTPPAGAAFSVAVPIKRMFSSYAITVMMPTTLTVLISMAYPREIGSVPTASILQMSTFHGISRHLPVEREQRQYQGDEGQHDLLDGDSYSNNNGIAHGRECEIEHGTNWMQT